MGEPDIDINLNTYTAIVRGVDNEEQATAILNKELNRSKRLTGGLQCVHSKMRSTDNTHVFDLQQYCEHLMGNKPYCLICGVDIGFVI